MVGTRELRLLGTRAGSGPVPVRAGRGGPVGGPGRRSVWGRSQRGSAFSGRLSPRGPSAWRSACGRSASSGRPSPCSASRGSPARSSCLNGITAARPGVRPTSRNVRRFAALAASTSGSKWAAASRQPWEYARSSRRSSSARRSTTTSWGSWASRRAPSSARSAAYVSGAGAPAGGVPEPPGPVGGTASPGPEGGTGSPAVDRGRSSRSTMCPSLPPARNAPHRADALASATTARFSLRSARTWRGASVHCCS